jgi:Immunity protein 8
MKAELKRLHSPDVHDLRSFYPQPADEFGFHLQIMVGPEGQQGEESFDVVVCTPDWLKRQFKTSDIVIGHGRILVFEYDYERLRSFIARQCAKCVADTWLEIASKLSRIGWWEFEGYQPDT